MFRTEEQQALDWNDPMSKKHKTHTHTHVYIHTYINAYYSELSKYQVKKLMNITEKENVINARDGVNK